MENCSCIICYREDNKWNVWFSEEEYKDLDNDYQRQSLEEFFFDFINEAIIGNPELGSDFLHFIGCLRDISIEKLFEHPAMEYWCFGDHDYPDWVIETAAQIIANHSDKELNEGY